MSLSNLLEITVPRLPDTFCIFHLCYRVFPQSDLDPCVLVAAIYNNTYKKLEKSFRHLALGSGKVSQTIYHYPGHFDFNGRRQEH